MSEEEKKAIDYLKNDVVYWLDKGKDFVVIDIGENEKLHSILNLIDKQKKEIEEKSTIIMAGAEKVKQLEKEIILLKIEKLRAMKLYKECHLSQIPDTANIYYSMKLELEAIDEEISNLIRIWENY